MSPDVFLKKRIYTFLNKCIKTFLKRAKPFQLWKSLVIKSIGRNNNICIELSFKYNLQ